MKSVICEKCEKHETLQFPCLMETIDGDVVLMRSEAVGLVIYSKNQRLGLYSKYDIDSMALYGKSVILSN